MTMSKYKFWRILAGCMGAYILAMLVLVSFFTPPEISTYYYWALIPLCSFMIYSIIYQMIYPLDLRLYVIWVFIFSFMSIAYGATSQALLILYCGLFLGKRIRFFAHHGKVKLVIVIIIFLGLSLCQLRFPKQEIIDSIAEFWNTCSAIIMMHLIQKHILKKIDIDIFNQIDAPEDINTYFEQYNFTERDKKMLEEVLAGCKYEEIAINHELSLSSVKKRLALLYKKLGVTCQIDFIIKFAPKGENSTKV